MAAGWDWARLKSEQLELEPELTGDGSIAGNSLSRWATSADPWAILSTP